MFSLRVFLPTCMILVPILFILFLFRMLFSLVLISLYPHFVLVFGLCSPFSLFGRWLFQARLTVLVFTFFPGDSSPQVGFCIREWTPIFITSMTLSAKLSVIYPGPGCPPLCLNL